MRLALPLLAGVAVVAAAFQRSEQVPLSSSVEDSLSDSGIITPRIISYLRQALEENGVPGYSLLVVRPGTNLEEQEWNWGKRTEDGQPVDSDVSLMLVIRVFLLLNEPVSSDTLYTWIVLESLPLDLGWSSDRRLCAWTQRDPAPEWRVGDQLEHEAQEPVAERFHHPRRVDPGEDKHPGCFVDDVWHPNASPVAFLTNSQILRINAGTISHTRLQTLCQV
jgi:hypothetical protein